MADSGLIYIMKSIEQKLKNSKQMGFNVNKCKLHRITCRKSTVIKYVHSMYQANALSDNQDRC